MNKKVPVILSVVFFLGLWEISSLLINSSLILPSPLSVLICLKNQTQTAVFWVNLCFTLSRIAAGFAITLILALILGTLCGKSAFWDSFLSFPFSVLKTTPVAALILILLFVFKSGTIPVISSVLMCLPVMSECVKNGILFDKNDLNQKKLYQMANIFRFTKTQNFIHIFFPAFRPFLNTGICSTFGMCWKVVTAGEILTVPKYAAGTFLYKNQISLETAQVLAMTIALVLISSLLEGLLKWMLKSKN